MKKIILTALLIFLSANFLFGKELKIYTEENPPIQYTDKNGKITGWAVEIVEEIKKRTGEKGKIEMMPWARSYMTIQNENDIVVFLMTRTEEREDLFKWVGPLAKGKVILIGKKGSRDKIRTIEDAKKVRAIGTVRQDSKEKILNDLGFKNLETVTTVEMNIAKLEADRIDLFVSTNLSWRYQVIKAGLKVENFEEIISLSDRNVIIGDIAFSNNVSDEVVKKWQDAYMEIVKDGTLKKIYNKWLPGEELPVDLNEK